ncbi:PAS domain S-box protein, partial [Caldilinea sp.]|uniref:hybrid sensor histidine kinase/response regulator n=1 Tax=Caldilinea sp. TaxID=2293560 RepID=UPI002CF2B6A4|nr:PAS domain S-box protein [Caldilinea sp.]
NMGWEVVRHIGPTVILLYPLGFLVIALVMLENERRRGLEEMLSAQNRILEMIAASAPLTATLESLAREIEMQAPGMMASILLLDEEGMHLRHVAAPSLPAAYLQAIDGQPIGEKAGSCGTAVWRKTQVIVEDIATDPLWANYREVALRHRLRACWSAPIQDNAGAMLGSFALYYHTVAKPTDFQLRLIDMSTHTAAIAIMHYRQEEALRAERDFARQVMDAMNEGLCVTDQDGRFTYVNLAFAAMVGTPLAEVLGHTPRDFVVEADHPLVDQSFVDFRDNEHILFEARLINRGVCEVPAQVSAVSRRHKDEYLGTITVITDLTERKRAEETLRESEARYRLLVDTSPYAIGIYQDSRLVFVNQSAARLLGASEPDVLIGKSIFDTVAPKEQAAAEERFRTMSAGESAGYTTETVYLRLDGSTVPVEVTAVPFVFQGREAVQIIAADITERKRRQRELEAQAKLTQAISETADLQVLLERILDAAVHAVAAAQKGTILLLDSSGQLRVQAWIGYQDPRMRNIAFSPEQSYGGRSLRSRKALLVPDVSVEASASRSSGIDELGAVKSAIVAPLIVQGEAIGVIALDSVERTAAFVEEDMRALSNIAVTAGLVLERARLFEEMKKNARQMEQVMQTTPQGLLLLDVTGKVVMANRTGIRDLAILTNARVGDMITQLGDLKVSELLLIPPVGPWHDVHADGRIFEIIARPISNHEDFAQWVVLIDDVTRSRQAEMEARQQERLATVGQLAAGIAHDFNNILTVILLHAQMAGMSAEMLDADRRRMAVIVEQTQYATELVRQILDFSRQSLLQRRDMDLRALVNEQVSLLQRTFPETIKVALVHGENRCLVHADPTRLRQVVVNLAINARDAMPHGGALLFELSKLSVAAEAAAPTPGLAVGEWIRLTVADTGTGIAPDVLPHIFDPFFTTKEPGKGTGLGLAQVHGIIAQHEGHLSVDTLPDSGTTFTIYLSAVETKQPAPQTVAAGVLPRGRGERILLVEDNPTLRYAIIEMLKSLDYAVLDAPNGRVALDLLASPHSNVALVLSDVVMPDMGGMALVDAMRTDHSNLPVVLMSGHPLDEDQENLRALGVTAWLLKPCSMTELAHMLARTLRR